VQVISIPYRNLNVPELLFGHPEVVTQFVYQRLSDLVADFGLSGADCFDILLIKHDVSRSHGKIKDALSRRWYAMKDARSNRLRCPGWAGDWFGGKSSTRIATF
jgi:hypothetical protein